MHLLATQPGQIESGKAVDLGQTPAEIVILSAADSDLSCLAAAQARRLAEDPSAPSLRLAHLLHLSHNYTVDLYVETVIDQARLILVRLLGGLAYWPYGVEKLVESTKQSGAFLALVPGDDQPDTALIGRSNLPPDALHRLWQYGVQGGVDNAVECLRYAATLITTPAIETPSETPLAASQCSKHPTIPSPPTTAQQQDPHQKSHIQQDRPGQNWREPRPLPRAGFYTADSRMIQTTGHDLDIITRRWDPQRPKAALLFYRALAQSADTAVIDALITALDQAGLDTLPIYVTSLKDPVAAALVSETLATHPPDIILNAVAFAVGQPGGSHETPYSGTDCPILQVVFAGRDQETWHQDPQGLPARDITMHVALPEIDGRLLSRAVAFKQHHRRDTATQCDITCYQPLKDRVDFVAELAAAWANLRRTPCPQRRIALILANYPNRDGRLGNGVGLDAPEATVDILRALDNAGYRITDIPENGDTLIARLKAGPTNDYRRLTERKIRHILPLTTYQDYFATMPQPVRDAVTMRWGKPDTDPFYQADRQGFAIAAIQMGQAIIGLQPARGYNIDPEGSYHDPALVPPHSYLAFYCWLRRVMKCHAVVHVGKHGNLEWLPGKALALSQSCFPEVALGPMPHLYPFIVNDPGEGIQAKRRTAATVVDHLTPALTRAGSYGPQAEIEALADEYFEASTTDPRRLAPLRDQIRDLLTSTGLDIDCGIDREESTRSALAKLDSYLCELKEMQIRDGLHIFGRSPRGPLLETLLRALVRLPRGNGEGVNQSLTRALAKDLGLSFDPLDCDLGAAWNGKRPHILTDMSAIEDVEDEKPGPWRLTGDTVERLEILALALITGKTHPRKTWRETRKVLDWINRDLRPLVQSCGPEEMRGLLTGLDGRFVPPGPSGAPTRGRLDVLPTGRNFYSVDTRSVPTPAAWELGWKSASRLVEHHAQQHGDWPQRLAITAWGTSNMRTGGDDIAQALALIGAKPCWDDSSRRVSGFEILPADILGRPRVDVMLRISGFFRDAFPHLIDLFDAASNAVAALDESADINPLAATFKKDAAFLETKGRSPDQARHQAAARVFGSRPGAYGAGLQALIDERGWQDAGDLARAYLAWGGYAYGGDRNGTAAHDLFAQRLSAIEVVVQNQDNREHDLLDSDDYYQFEGGISAAVEHLSGQEPTQYHLDHTRPFSPRIYSLSEEISRVLRGRAINPKWISGVMRHGYKGAFEMAATIDYLFAFAATTSCVQNHHFDAIYQAYFLDDTVREFLQNTNPDALAEMSERLKEAIDRALWQPRSNSAHAVLDELKKVRPTPGSKKSIRANP